jgi:tetratricopeptide (TPR) repeat protein
MHPRAALAALPALIIVLLLTPPPETAQAAESPFERRAADLATELHARATSPEAIAPLAALIALEEDLPPGRLLEPLRAVADSHRSHPLVAAQASFYLAAEELRRGDRAAADQRLARLAFWNSFWVVGPFDAQGRSGLDRVYPPEQRPLDPRRPEPFPGKERDVTWRQAPPAVMREGALFVDGMLRPESDAVAYVLAVVNSPGPREAALRLGTPGPVKAWVNGALVLQRNAARAATPDQDAASVSLRAGENWVLIKTVIGQGAWRVFLRFTDQQGRPLTGLEPVPTPHGPGPPLAAARPTRPAIDLGTLLRKRATSPAAWLDYARFLTLVQPEDSEKQPVESALAKAGGSSEALLLLGQVAREEDDRRAALERVVARTGEKHARALALTRLGELARQRRREAAASAAWRQALVSDPDCWPATLAIAFDEQAAGLGSAALRRLQALPAEVRLVPRVARARARVLEGLGRRREAEAALAELGAVRHGDLDILQEVAGARRGRGDLAGAVILFREAADRRPDLPFMTFEVARSLEGLGKVDEARTLLASLSARLPDDPGIPEELGRLLVRANRVPEALPYLQRALVLRPQNPVLRRYAERLAGESGQGSDRAGAAEDLAKRYATEAEPVARPALAEPAATSAKAADGSVVLLDRRVVRVHRNGLSEVFVQRLTQVRTDRAARDNQEFYVRYTPGSQEVEIRQARILRQGATGQVEVSEATGRDDRDLSEPWYGLYYDNRAEVVSFEGLRAGDVVEVQYTVADVALHNEMADYFGDFQFIGDTAPKRRWDYTLIAPAERPLYFNKPKVAGLESSVDQSHGEVIYRFAAADVPRVETEPSMPGFAEEAPYLHASTYKTWDDVGRWYWHLVEDQLAADDTLRRAAAEATRGLRTDEEKIRALHRLVIEGTRYVGLEFGIHGFKPYKVTQVLARRFGDCKDKASLLLALLREAGIDAELVLVRTRRGGKVDTAPASLAVFDHAIVYVPRLSLYLDGTAEWAGMRELPSQDQGVMVLRVSARTATLTETPVLPASTNRAARSWKVALEAGGGARIDEDLTVTGQAAPEWRMHYQTPGEREERYGKVWSGRFPGAKLESLRFDGVEDRNRPVVLHALVSVPRLAEARAGGSLQLPVTARDTEFVRAYARLSRRQHDLQLAFPWLHEEELTFHLPDGWKVVRQPSARHERNAFGRFELEVVPLENGRALRVRSLIEVERHRIAPADYGAFRKFLGSIDAALGERIVVAREEG